ncbi:matrixin family metalloprotease [Bacillus timonensis]|nr:matrixin family metalloprotease [Bacillus timonensis]
MNANYSFTTSTSGSGKYLPTVVLHEVGHALGLDHVGSWYSTSDTKEHVMYYTYTGSKSLHSHDIDGVKAIY